MLLHIAKRRKKHWKAHYQNKTNHIWNVLAMINYTINRHPCHVCLWIQLLACGVNLQIHLALTSDKDFEQARPPARLRLHTVDVESLHTPVKKLLVRYLPNLIMITVTILPVFGRT